MLIPNLYSFGKNVKIVHFIGSAKPWKASFHQSGDPVSNRPENFHLDDHLKHWWQMYNTEIRPRMGQKVGKKRVKLSKLRLL